MGWLYTAASSGAVSYLAIVAPTASLVMGRKDACSHAGGARSKAMVAIRPVVTLGGAFLKYHTRIQNLKYQ